MLTNTICIATNVGESELIIDKYGYVVKVGDFNDLAEKFFKVYNSYKTKLNYKYKMREHIINNFSINSMIERYSKVWNIR